MDKLWAPWRIKYIQSKTDNKCLFCEAAKDKNNKHQKHVIFKTKFSIVLLNIYPYNNGHLMIAPKRHESDITCLNQDEVLDLFDALKKAKQLLESVLKPQGFNIGINMSDVAGAGIPGHIHVHIVPRWKGDTNFMPVLFETKVISQSLAELHKRLKDAYKRSR